MNAKVRREVKDLIQKLNLNCSVQDFQDKVDWFDISHYQKLSEDFIREFQNKVDWYGISRSQKLSEPFIREFQSKVYWPEISRYQTLSEPFIREFQNKVNWEYISADQKLSEPFIREFQDKVDWFWISQDQKLSKEFKDEFASRLSINPLFGVQKLHDKLESSWFGSSLSKKIVLFQEALTTAHNNGTMSEYLIDGKNVRGLLRSLSSKSNPYKPKWDQDLTKLLSHPPGSTIAPKEDVWIQPASKRLARVINYLSRSYLKIAIGYLIQAQDEKISRSDLIRIYELTYKLQMLKQEEKLGDYGISQTLSDKVYMELSKYEGELEGLLDYVYPIVVDVYEGWIDRHTS